MTNHPIAEQDSLSPAMFPIWPISEADRTRFWRYVKRAESGCWPWVGGSTRRDGRGRFWLHGKLVIAPRVAWAIANGREPDAFVLHSCDNPPCCNPAHLWLGTHTDNARDKMRKGRHAQSHKTHCKHGHEYTDENTAYFFNGRGQFRACRACARVARAKWRAIQ